MNSLRHHLHFAQPIRVRRKVCSADRCAYRRTISVINLRSDENGTFSDALEPRIESFIRQAGFARRNDERTFGRVALHRPAAIALLQGRVVGPIADSERALELNPQRPAERVLPSALASARSWLTTPSGA